MPPLVRENRLFSMRPGVQGGPSKSNGGTLAADVGTDRYCGDLHYRPALQHHGSEVYHGSSRLNATSFICAQLPRSLKLEILGVLDRAKKGIQIGDVEARVTAPRRRLSWQTSAAA